MIPAQLESLLQSLQYGVKISSMFGITKIPSPTPNMLIFQRDITQISFITLQAQTSLINDLITRKEIDNICRTVGDNTYSRMDRPLYTAFKYTKLLVFLVAAALLPLPIIALDNMGFVYGIIIFGLYFLLIFSFLMTRYIM